MYGAGNQSLEALAFKRGSIHSEKRLNDTCLEGKIYFNLGAAHADNPRGDLKEAFNCYSKALIAFKKIEARDDVTRTSLRLGKVHLLQNEYTAVAKILNEVRPQISNHRIMIHADYLEAQLKVALKDMKGALEIAERGLSQAKIIGAKEDATRLSTLIETIENKSFN